MDCLKIATSLKANSDTFQFCPFITPFFHIRLREYAILSNAFNFQRLCENEMGWCLNTVYQLSMLMSIYDYGILTHSLELICPC